MLVKIMLRYDRNLIQLEQLPPASSTLITPDALLLARGIIHIMETEMIKESHAQLLVQ